MNQQSGFQGVEERLRLFAQSRDLPASLRDQAQRYLSRLVSPVRVTVFGRPSPGKRSLLASAVDETLLPKLTHPPTIELRYGIDPNLQITRADGSVTEPRDSGDPAVYNDAILAVIERPIPLLRRISFLDVQADEAAADQRAAIAWAAPRTDIALWCAGDFGETDQSLWDGVPDQIKDHAYLILTDSDVEHSARIKAAFREEFHDIYRIDLTAPREVSGIEDLTDKLLDHARLGRQADADSALFFLRAQEAALEEKPRRVTTRPVTIPRPVAVASEIAVEPSGAPADHPGQEAASGHDTDGAPADPSTVAEQGGAPTTEGYEVFSAGLLFIRKRAAAVLGSLRAGEEILDSVITAHCGETLVHLSDMLASHDDMDAPAVVSLTDAVMEAESLVILMENERGEQPALDAVTILMQVRREFEMRLAA